MRLAAPIAFIALSVPALTFDANNSGTTTWTGYLVDARCYASWEKNINPGDEDTSVDRDRGFEIRYCRPTPKTRSFALVAAVGEDFRIFNDAGNRMAAGIVPTTPKKASLFISVTGQQTAGDRNGKIIQVDSISPVR